MTVVCVAVARGGFFHDDISKLAGPQPRKEFDGKKLKSTTEEGLDIENDGEKKEAKSGQTARDLVR